jgi:hypothetical protein
MGTSLSHGPSLIDPEMLEATYRPILGLCHGVLLLFIMSACGDDTTGGESSNATSAFDGASRVTDGAGIEYDEQVFADDAAIPFDDLQDAILDADASVTGPDQGRLDMATTAMDTGAMADPLLTWTDCRQKWAADRLTAGETNLCDSRFRESPVDRIFGIRFIFLNAVDDPAHWIAPRLHTINRIFAPAQMSFIQAQIIDAAHGEIQVIRGGPTLSLQARLTDLRIHLEMPDATIDECLDTLKARLLDSGADLELATELGSESEFDNRGFLFLMARATPKEIYFVVTDLISEEMNVGGWAMPPFHPVPTLERSIVAVRHAAPSVTIPAHELGHYFGLKHTHAHSRSGDDAHLFQSGRLMPTYRARETHNIFDVLQIHLGPNYDDDSMEVYPSYDEPAQQYADFEALRFALMDTWVRWKLTYGNNLEAYETLGGFMEDAQNRAQIGQLNFIADQNQNNCLWHPDTETFKCAYPAREEPLTGASPLLRDRLLFDEGREVNVMSYIRQAGPEAIPRGYGLFEEQIHVLKVSANAPQRLSLRNYALETTD